MNSNESPGVPDARRRSLLKGAVIGVNGLFASLMGVPVLGYLIGPLFREKELHWVEAGKVSDFDPEKPQAKRLHFKSRNGFRELELSRNVWIDVKNQDLTVFSSECTHVGCNVIWKSAENQFICPCHGGIFARDGQVVDGPPPRPLERLPSRIENETIYVQV